MTTILFIYDCDCLIGFLFSNIKQNQQQKAVTAHPHLTEIKPVNAADRQSYLFIHYRISLNKFVMPKTNIGIYLSC